MIKSMTGFGSKEAEVKPFGKICVELRSTNHKFLESVLHLPEGFLSLEERLKKEIEAKIKRGRVTCVINILGAQSARVFINKPLLKNYIALLKNVRRQYRIKDEVSMNTLINLPGILSLEEEKTAKLGIWPHLKALINYALDDLVKTRQKEGRAIYGYLKNRAETLKVSLGVIKARFQKAITEKLNRLHTDEERASFLKNSDITEEIERLAFHTRNFKDKLAKSGPIGKELDFIAQEMQREANTMAAKLFVASISGRVVQMKSQIEKIREQVQNVE